MKKIRIIAVSAMISAAVLASADDAKNKIKYISPNNDGVQDELTIPLKISEKRLITGWSLVIEDSNGNVVRTIGNKVALPSKVTAGQFFKQLVTPKKGVDVPSSVTWNGFMDNGERAPDGTYSYYFTATDDNNNTGKTEKYTVVVDTKAPEIALTQPSDKIFGEGAKAEFKIRQSGSSEDKWTGVFKNAQGEIVKTLSWENGEPESFSWNGKNNDGGLVYDGVYSYEITATDRAGNVSPNASISNIIYSAEKPVTSIYIVGSKYFSPATDSKKSTVKFNVKIPVPDAKTGNKLSEWKIEISGTNGKICKTYSGDETVTPPSEIIFDGLDENGNAFANGRYTAQVTAKYLNGYVPKPVNSPEFVLDTVKPSAQLSASEKVFGAGSKDKVTIQILTASKTLATVPAWKGKIYNKDDNSVVREYNFGEFPPESISWNGFDTTGKLAKDGDYLFEISATDLAGNSNTIVTDSPFTLDTREANLLVSMGTTAFSPNNNKVKDTIVFTPVVKDASVTSYKFEILDGNKVVKTFQGTGKLPETFVWDGKDNDNVLCEDKYYSAKLSVVSANGSKAEAVTEKFLLDTKAPVLNAVAKWSTFSPDGDGNQDTVPVLISSCTNENLWVAQVMNSKNEPVRTFKWKGKVNTNGISEFEWNGTDDNGNKVPDGKYSIVLSSEDDAGNKFSTVLNGLTLDSRETKAYVISEYEGISPNGDSTLDVQKFTNRISVKDGIKSWNFDVRSENGTSVRGWSDKDSANVPETILWDGLDSKGNVAEGTFTGTLKIVYDKGNIVNAVSSPFICTATPPALKVSTSPKYFSPDNDGTDDDLFIKLSGSTKALIKDWSFKIFDPRGKEFWVTEGKSSITERIIWDGLSNVQKNSSGRAELVQSATDYPYEFKVTDNLGMTSVVKGVIPVDVLVIRDGDFLKMAVPSIIFRSDAADFKTDVKNGLDPEKAANNEKVLNRIADILNKFKDYKVTIVGHANRMTDNDQEETVANPNVWGPALIPLSGERAEFVKSYLVKKGVSASRLTTEGKGGTELVVNFRDKDNNWKNRRVEFILQK